MKKVLAIGASGFVGKRLALGFLSEDNHEHWDELNVLDVFQQIAAATVRKVEGQ